MAQVLVAKYRQPTIPEMVGPVPKDEEIKKLYAFYGTETLVDISRYIEATNVAGNVRKSSVIMYSRGEFVTLRGPLYVKVYTEHRTDGEAYYKIETVRVPPEGMTFMLEEKTDVYPGDWQMAVLTVAEEWWMYASGVAGAAIGGLGGYLTTKNIPIAIVSGVVGTIIGPVLTYFLTTR